MYLWVASANVTRTPEHTDDVQPCGECFALVRPADISRHIGDIRRLLAQTGNTIQPATSKLATLEALYRHAAAHGIHVPDKIKTAC